MTGPTVGSPTPWGPAEQATELAAGIVWVSTPSYGGVWLSRARWAELPEPFRSVVPFAHRGEVGEAGVVVPWQGPTDLGAWYEEDEDATLAVLAWPELHDARTVWELLEGDGCRWCASGVLTAIRAWLRSPASAEARRVAETWGRAHATWWLPSGAASDGAGWRRWYRQVGTGDRALRWLTTDEYLDLPDYDATPELPGVAAGHTRAHRRAS